ncbi:hypothetical protein ACKWTF_015836 [Chironomus riparius]
MPSSFSHTLILIDDAFLFPLKDSSEFQAIQQRFDISKRYTKVELNDLIINQQFALIRPSEIVDFELSSNLFNGRTISEYYYKLPESIFPRPKTCLVESKSLESI